MVCSSRGRSLFVQLVAPVVGLVLAGVLANVAFAAWFAGRNAVVMARGDRERIVETLSRSRITLTPAVLDALRRLTGSHIVVWDDAADAPGSSTLDQADLDAVRGALETIGDGGSVLIAGRRHAVGVVRASGVRPERALVLTPVKGLLESSLAAAWPVLAVATATLAVLVPLGLAATGRLAARISAIERHVERISHGEFGTTLVAATAAATSIDEVERLASGVDRLSVELASLRSSLVTGERQRLLGQLAAGFAHELRNAITGARLAIDLHRRRCTSRGGPPETDDSLAVACRQLDIVEEEVRGLLALGKPQFQIPARIDIASLVDEVRELTGPRCGHTGVALTSAAPTNMQLIGYREALRAALVNLALNAIDAAGPGGRVTLRGEDHNRGIQLIVEDDGPGPPTALAAAMHEPFVTGRAEGIGLGLAVAKAVAEQHGGTLHWARTAGLTRFVIDLPPAAPAPAPEPVA